MVLLIATLNHAHQSLHDFVEKREEKFDARTEKWQESERGQSYLELTDRMAEMRDELEGWIEELEDQK